MVVLPPVGPGEQGGGGGGYLGTECIATAKSGVEVVNAIL